MLGLFQYCRLGLFFNIVGWVYCRTVSVFTLGLLWNSVSVYLGSIVEQCRCLPQAYLGNSVYLGSSL